MRGIIQLAGYKRAGKDTVGQMLTELGGVQLFSYAKPLKDFARNVKVRCEHCGEETRLWDGGEGTKRPNLVNVGDGVREYIDGRVWVSALWERKDVEKAAQRVGVVITDCRYLNEAQAGEKFGQRWGVPHQLWWIENPDAEPHPTELLHTSPLKSLASVVIHNSRHLPLDKLREQVEAHYREFTKKFSLPEQFSLDFGVNCGSINHARW
jgi:hypothetical protein